MPTYNKDCNDPVRFAPSTTGRAHPGTLLSALICWLDARSRGAQLLLRMENLDPDRCRPEYEQGIVDDLAWFGLDWDTVIDQRANRERHEDVLDRLADAGLLYACQCSRSRLRDIGRAAPDGGFAYDNACRPYNVTRSSWRNSDLPIRLRLPDRAVCLTDETGLVLDQHPVHEMGDPVVRRRDGAIAYHLACVVDDHDAGIQRLIRGRDLAASAPTQILLHELLGWDVPRYFHHLLLLERHDRKLAKFHGAVAAPELRRVYTPEGLCGLLAGWAGLQPTTEPCRPADLLPAFSWSRLNEEDVVVHWDGASLSRA